ncbi:hypothetical protein [Luteolibacter luteus]|uniref:Uncharacterized protein n=1 Tax=Luteolibacter luteus TaxID=2728835 RepID=A0A858RMP0_9BACT|nr:hypothetical protein [Luteolibacter luteus]QJE97754.1 hypothetical protein HHL09_18860 [Luteolibacter luteus]
MAGVSPVSPVNLQGLDLPLVRDDLWFRAQQALHLIPRDGRDGVLRRTVIFTLLAWLPLVIWALVTGRVFESTDSEPLLRHFALHARFLIALPALIFGERVARSVMRDMLPSFVATGLVTEEKIPAFRQIVQDVIRLKNSSFPWVGVAGLIVVVLLVPETGRRLQELSWSRERDHLGFGGWWYLCVSRPIFQIFMLGWVWRILLVTLLFQRFVKLGLNPIASHPDNLGSLGFIEKLPRAFVPLAFAMSCVICGQFAHEMAWHGAHMKQFQIPLAIFAVVAFLFCVAPLLVFIPVLKSSKRVAMNQYGALVAQQNRQVHRKWIEGEPVEDRALLEAPELGPTTDVNAIFEAVREMRTVPFSKKSLITVAIPVALPMLVLAAIEVPLGEILMKIFKTII